MDAILQLMKSMPPLKSKKNPTTASILGFLFGGFALGIYLWSFIDFIIPLLLWFLFFFIFVGINIPVWIAGIIGGSIAAAYGYFRVLSSNERIEAQGQGQRVQ